MGKAETRPTTRRHATLGTTLSLTAALALLSCGSGQSVDEFNKAFADGDLPKAQELVGGMDDGGERKDCALQLVEAYLSIDEPDKAAYVYERITRDHYGRSSLEGYNSGKYWYERKACKMLREYLVAHGDYEKAWNYYPLDSNDENYPGNAKSRYIWLSDVADALSKAGSAERARRFVDDNLRWYVLYVDMASDAYSQTKADYNSELVRQRLYAQIDNTR